MIQKLLKLGRNFQLALYSLVHTAHSLAWSALLAFVRLLTPELPSSRESRIFLFCFKSVWNHCATLPLHSFPPKFFSSQKWNLIFFSFFRFALKSNLETFSHRLSLSALSLGWGRRRKKKKKWKIVCMRVLWDCLRPRKCFDPSFAVIVYRFSTFSVGCFFLLGIRLELKKVSF